jgi:twitching motility protein PilT
MARIDQLLESMKNQRGSVLHVGVGTKPRIRVAGVLRELDNAPSLSNDEVEQMVREIAGAALPAGTDADGPGAWTGHGSHATLDFAYDVDHVGRFRVHCYQRHDGSAVVLRAAPDMLTSDELGLPSSVQRLAHLLRGLVIVAGPTGGGKSTTLAAIVDEINNNRVKHVVTVESPIEFVHNDCRSTFSQREVGEHTRDLASGLRAAMRMSPDVLVAGELRDADAADAAFAAAEAGILVLTTVSANGVVRALERLLQVYPEDRQPQARNHLGEVLGGVVSQLLLPSVDGLSRCLAAEVLVRSRSVAAAVRDGDFSALEPIMQRTESMQTMDDALEQLVKRRRISSDAAYDHARDKTRFE